MIQLLDIQRFLINEMNNDPVLCLAKAVAWLDPYWDEFTDEDDDYGGDGGLGMALRVIRSSFPILYVQVIEQLREGHSWDDIDRFVCREIEKLGIPLENLEWMGYGIPLPSYGVRLEEPDFYESHPDVIPILAAFGIDPSLDNYTVDIPECAYAAGQLIAKNLEGHSDERYRELSWLMQWLFSYSGNSVIDLDYEAMCEFQPLSWDKDDLEFAIAIIEEANVIMREVQAGLAFINNHNRLLIALQHNVHLIYQKMSRQNDKHEQPNIQLKWPIIDLM